jgi:hypothetical protein
MSRGSVAVLTLAAMVAMAVPGGSLGAPSGGGGKRPCEPEDSTTLLATRFSRVYQVARERNGRSTLYTYGCLRSTGSQLLLASDAEPAALFPRPAISLIGPYAGYAVDTDTEPTEKGGRMTYVEVDDLRPQKPGKERAGLVVAAGPRDVARVGSLKVSRTGAVAWVACPAPSEGQLASDPSGACTRPGTHARVYRARLRESGTIKLELLDKGRGIDPHSLRREKHSSVSWKHGRRVLIAKLR